jgi:hypothetical protein
VQQVDPAARKPTEDVSSVEKLHPQPGACRLDEHTSTDIGLLRGLLLEVRGTFGWGAVFSDVGL